MTNLQTGLAYKGTSPSSFSVRAGALGLWSVIRTGGYSGPCLNLRRSSDNATQDIGFIGDVVDSAAADAFVGANNTGFVTKWYDQSGNGKDLTQSVAATQPVFVRSSQWNGIRPITEPKPGNASVQPGFLENAGVSFNNNSCTIVTVVSPRASYNTCAYWRTAVNAAGADKAYLVTALSSLISGSSGLGNVTTGKVPVAGIKIAALSYGAATTIDFDNKQTVLGATTSQALGYISFGNLLITSPTQYNFHGDYFFVALYPTTFTPGQLLTLRTILSRAFVPPSPTMYNIVYGGNSLVAAYGGTNAKTLPYVAGFGRATVDDGNLPYPALPNWKCFQIATGGRTLAAEYAARAIYLAPCFDATKSKNVYVVCDITNDIGVSGGYASTAAAQTAMNTLFNGTMVPYISAIKAAGYSAVIVPTVIPRGDYPFQLRFGNFMEDARVYWNLLVKIKAGKKGYIVSDRTVHYPFNIQTGYNDAVYYSADKTHPTDAGTAIMAGSDLAAILSA